MAERPFSTTEFRDGLQLDRLNPPSIQAFFQGLPRRVREHLTGLSDESSTLEAVVQTVHEMADETDQLIEALSATGYALNPRVETAQGARATDLPELAAPLRRIDGGATETVRRLSGIPLQGWEANPDLIDKARTTVAEVATRIRDLAATAHDADVDADENDED